MSRFIAMLAALAVSGQANAATPTDHSDVLLFEWRGAFTAGQKTKLKDWQSSVMETMALLHGQLPRQPIRIAFQPYPGSTAVPFARVLRRDPEGVLYYVNPERPLDEFIADWTAYHEMSHLFIPYPGMPDIWFSEGLASYYQNILQYRAGLLTGAEARMKLRNGFERGRKDDGHEDLTLRELSAAMRERHAYMRVYWSGALYFLEADLALREATGSKNINSLDDVLREYGECCLNGNRQTGAELAREFDRIAGRDLFVPMYESYSRSYAIPEYATALESAGMDSILPTAPRASNLTVQ